MKVGYARISATDQHIEPQLERLSDCERMFYDKKSGRDRDRAQLNAALEYVREGDTLVCTRLDRLARSVKHLCEIADTLKRKGVSLVVLDQAIDTTTPVGVLLFHVLAAIAEFEVMVRKDQQRAGIESARSRGVAFGNHHKLSEQDVAQLHAWRAQGMTISEIATRLSAGQSTIYRYLALPPTG